MGESDVYSQDIYDLGDRARMVISADVARVFVDLNRAPEGGSALGRDGIIKEITRYGARVFFENDRPAPDLCRALIEKYYLPYHRRIEQALAGPGIELAIDCHTMAGIGPPNARDAGQRRPLICLGNDHGRTCPNRTVLDLKKSLARAFDIDEGRISLNKPYAGGYITRKYGSGPVPWIQVEMSKAMYLDYPFSRRSMLEFRQERLFELNDMFARALELFFNKS